MNVITYNTLKRFIEREAGQLLNTDLFWGKQEIKVFPPKKERLYFNLFRNLRRTSFKGKYHKKDNGHTIISSDIPKYIYHFQKTKVFPYGAITVIP